MRGAALWNGLLYPKIQTLASATCDLPRPISLDTSALPQYSPAQHCHRLLVLDLPPGHFPFISFLMGKKPEGTQGNSHMSADTLLARARAMKDALVAVRRDIHRHPKLAFEEQRTAAKVGTGCRV